MQRRKFLLAATQAITISPFLSHRSLAANAQSKTTQPAILVDNFPDPVGRDFFYRPQNAWAGDFIPFYNKGEFHLFYLLDFRDVEKHGEGTPWYRISTKNFVDFKEHGEMIPRGTPDEQDLFIFTGSAIEAKGQYHIFYTGHNHHLTEKGIPTQAVMHAVSDDLQHWKKNPDQKFYAPADRYEPNDWRDPFVFWNEESKEYNMLVAARFKNGIPRRRGLTALSSSTDLVNWKVKEPFYMPDLYYTHECPDLFKMGDWWYLIFSEFTDKVQTRYRMSRSLKGPWITPERDSFDGHAFYAAKTASDGNKRFIFGWNPTRSDNKDSGNWNWGGNLVVHEIYQQKDGALAVRIPDTIADAFNKKNTLNFNTGSGKVTVSNGTVKLTAAQGFAASSAGVLPDRCKIETTLHFEKNTQGCGLMLRTDDNYENTYYIRLEPHNRRLVFDMWPRTVSEVPYMSELERNIALLPDTPVTIKILIDGTVGVAYVNNEVAMNFRMYNLPKGNWGIFAQEGNAVFSDTSLSTM